MLTPSLAEHVPVASFLNILAVDLPLSVQHSDRRTEVNCQLDCFQLNNVTFFSLMMKQAILRYHFPNKTTEGDTKK